MCGPHILSRPSPIPALAWADSSLLWQSMMAPDIKSKDSRSSKMFETNPEVQPKMRSILLDWLIEVAEVYKLHRETYYLAQDYVDRVLSASKETPKSELQLLGMSCKWIFSQHFLHALFFSAGITCLFIASKVEEIYPPKVNEFAYVTDGACTEKAIIDHEIFVLQVILVYFELLDFDSNFHFIQGKFGIFPHCFGNTICVLHA
jgi:G1/S-specific cyclin-E1